MSLPVALRGHFSLSSSRVLNDLLNGFHFLNARTTTPPADGGGRDGLWKTVLHNHVAAAAMAAMAARGALKATDWRLPWNTK